MNDIERQFRVSEAASISGLRECTWRKWILLRRIRVNKIGRSVRIPESELRRVLNENSIPARPRGGQ